MSTVLPNHVLRLMSPADRAKLGPAGLTSEEAMAAHECRTEKELQELIVLWLMAHRGVNRVIRSRTDKKTTTEAGTPDLLFLYKHIPHAWELKTPTGKVTVAQERAAVAFLNDGWRWAVIRSFSQAWDIIERQLREEPITAV